MANPGGAHRQGYWYRRQSSATPGIGGIAEIFPTGAAELGLQAIPRDAGSPEPERRFGLCFTKHGAQATLDQHAQCHAFTGGDFACFGKQTVRNIDRCLHTHLYTVIVIWDPYSVASETTLAGAG